MNRKAAEHNPDREIRERLVNRGAEALTDAELLSILLRTGNEGRPAVELAGRLLAQFDGHLVKLGRCELSQMRQIENLGIGRAAMVAAAMELGRRFRADESFMRDVIRNNREVIDMFQPLLSDLPYEEFWAVYLSASNRVLDKVKVSQGGVSGTVVDHRIIVKRAVEVLASALILVHNHPSGNPQPSDEDREVTEKVARAASLFDIMLADHVIITAGECYSFRGAGFFNEAPDPGKPGAQ